jgi:hypothetical protein
LPHLSQKYLVILPYLQMTQTVMQNAKKKYSACRQSLAYA